MTTFTDPVIGEMSFDCGWRKKEKLKKNIDGEYHDIEVVCQSYKDTDKVSESQRLAYKKFYSDIADFGSYFLKLGRAMNVYKEKNSIEGIMLLTPKTLFIDRNGNYGLLCDCNWDKEHGCAIFFTHDDSGVHSKEPAQIYIGEQDEIL